MNNGNGGLSANIFNQEGVQQSNSNYTFTWYTGNSTGASNQLSNSGTISGAASSSISGLDGGNYTILAVENSTGCQDSSTFELKENIESISLESSDYNLSDNTNCDPLNGSITLDSVRINNSPTANLSDFRFTWYNVDDIDSLSIGLSGTNNSEISGLGLGTYKVIIFNTSTSCEDSSFFNVDDDAVLLTYRWNLSTATTLVEFSQRRFNRSC